MTKITNDTIIKAKELFSQSFTQETNEAKETMERFDELYQNNNLSDEIAFVYSKALLNLVDKLPINEAIATVDKLKSLLQEHNSNQHIAVRYARGLANLIYKQDLKDAAKSIKQLETLQDEYNDNSDVASGYVGGLVNLAIKGWNADETIEVINSLLDKFKNDEGFAKFAAKAINVIRSKQID